MFRPEIPQVEAVGFPAKKQGEKQGGLGDAQEHAQISCRGQQGRGCSRLVGLHVAQDRGAVWRQKQGLAQAKQHQVPGNNQRRGCGFNRGEQQHPQGGDAQPQGGDESRPDIIGKPAGQGRDQQDRRGNGQHDHAYFRRRQPEDPIEMKRDEQDYGKEHHEGKHGAGYGQAEVTVAKKRQGQQRMGQPGFDGDKAAQGARPGRAGEEQPGG